MRATHLSLPLFALALPLIGACHQPAPDQAAAEGEANWSAEQAATRDVAVATVAKIHGLRGVQSPDLPEGAFMGEGATIHAGQWITLPRGTRVELELSSGQRLRLDEDSRLGFAKDGSANVELTQGRLVVLADDKGPIEVRAANDRLVVERGEAELHATDETRHFGVIQGRALLFTDGREIPLSPGASISTPTTPSTRPQTPPDPQILAAAVEPTLSLAPLQQAAWASAFEQSAQLASDVPRGVGSLVARRAGSSVERQSLRLTEQRVSVSISGRIARTEIEQAFHNDSSQTLEGIYQFPLPADASISDLQLLVGDTWMRGEMLEKQRARQIFRQIVDATVPRDPALLQWEAGGVFKLNIFPIPGKGERRIKIAYTQVLPAVGDALRYRYPMGGSGATATEIGDFEFDVEIDGTSLDAESLAQVATPMAELARTQARGGGLRLSMREREYLPTHELGVDIPLPAEQQRVQAATHRDRDGQGYFMLTLEPKLELAADPRPVHYAFVLDRSHGTTPELWAAAKGMTKAMISTLEPDDRFTVLACDSACDQLGGELQRARGSEAALDRFLDAQSLAGASDLGNMLERADDALTGEAGEVERVVVYFGDGTPTSGALTPDELGELAREQLGSLRIQAVALGARSDLLVLDSLVRQSGGDLLQADARDDLDALARELRLRAQVPVARDLALDLPSGLTDVYPRSIPALRPGDSLTVFGKLADGAASQLRGDVRLHGRGPAGVVDERFQVMLDAEYSKSGASGIHAHLPRTWAQQEITHLTQTEGADARDRIVELSREFNVLSRFTALLVLENDRMYREFNVARQAEAKHGWDGVIDSAAATAVPSGAAPNTIADATTSEAAEKEASKSNSSGGQPSKDEFDPLAPSAPAERRSREPSAFAEDDEDEDEAEEFEGSIGGGDFGDGGSGRAAGGFAPEPSPKKSSKPKPAPSPANKIAADEDPFNGGWSGSGGGGGGEWQDAPRDRGRHWRPSMQVRAASGPSASERARIVELQAARDRNPADRQAHRKLVREAARDGDPNALAFAAAWAVADPDHAPALLAHADMLAAAGDPLAGRAYASAIEVDPFSTKLHARMADALTFTGDLERACSHRRALVSIDPSDGQHAAALVECLVESGRQDDARLALSNARQRVLDSKGIKTLDQAARTISEGVRPAKQGLHGNPELRAELRWPARAGERLEIAFVDRRGQRLSGLRPQGVLIREQREGDEIVQILTMRKVTGTVFIEVTRPDRRSEDTVRARMTVKAVGAKDSFALRLDPGTQRVALARWP
ncbi:hypothetical protein DB30_04860 [Enhygromyxa salina]|uniref:Vault protein inter-alpha-trypsin n=1 Tax=Enhygromyxa salina TaxID=215803 RepID=A0A0C2D814_9BACT|nr:VIT domain-containing protein [Enhygromyxa salina]KIG16142.1 hypothetical protein DB30_04860 [Enhygromyxa salina]